MHDQILSVEVIVTLEDFVDDDPPLLRDALAAALQELLEPLLRRQRDFDRSQRKIFGHGQEVAATLGPPRHLVRGGLDL